MLFFCDLLKQRRFWTQKWYKRKLYKQFFMMKTKRTMIFEPPIYTSDNGFLEVCHSLYSLSPSHFQKKKCLCTLLQTFSLVLRPSSCLFVCLIFCFFVLFVNQCVSFFSGQIFLFLPVYTGF